MYTYIICTRIIKKLFTVYRVCVQFTMDVIARTVFGLDVDSQANPDNDFIRHGKSLMSLGNSLIKPKFLLFSNFTVQPSTQILIGHIYLIIFLLSIRFDSF